MIEEVSERRSADAVLGKLEPLLRILSHLHGVHDADVLTKLHIMPGLLHAQLMAMGSWSTKVTAQD